MFSVAYEILGGKKRKAQSIIDSLKIIRPGLPVEQHCHANKLFQKLVSDYWTFRPLFMTQNSQ